MAGRAGSWFERHPRVLDIAVVVPVLLYSLHGFVGMLGTDPAALVGVLLTVGVCAPWVFRREAPLASFAVMAALSFVQWVLDVLPMAGNLLLVAGVYNVASRCSRRVSVPTAGVVLLGAVLVMLRWGPDPVSVPFVAVALLYAVVTTVTAWMWGYTIGLRRAHVAHLQERAVALERERDDRARIAAVEERARIARDLHDVVSHGLSAVVVLADGAALSLRSAPDRADRALNDISRTGRDALDELHRMLHVLREDEAGASAPAPGLDGLEDLVADARAGGLPVELAVHGYRAQDMPAGTQVTVYRMVQEALTNVRRHAGTQVGVVRVELRHGEGRVEVRVSDDGCGPALDTGELDGHGGHGLVGMRERVSAHGGSLYAGAGPGGGFEVVAALPLERETEAVS